MALFRFSCLENGASWTFVVPPYESKILLALRISSNGLLNTTYCLGGFLLLYGRGNSSRPSGLSRRENGPHRGDIRLGPSSIVSNDSLRITREGW